MQDHSMEKHNALFQFTRKWWVCSAIMLAWLVAGQFLPVHQAFAYTIKEFNVPHGLMPAGPNGITNGPDGGIWFTESAGNKIGRISTSGVITEFAVPTQNSGPSGISAGPDGSLWFTESAGNKIGRISTSGVITEFTIPTQVSSPAGITAGPDGNLWFTETGGNKIGRITTSGVITEFTIPTQASIPAGITAGPDGNLWFTENASCKIARITPTGGITEFQGPVKTFPGPFGPASIVAGYDGNLWFNVIRSGVGRITTSGMITMFQIPGGDSRGIAAHSDGSLWITSYVYLIKLSAKTGEPLTFLVPTTNSRPTGITIGPDGNPWFTEYNGNNIGRLTMDDFTVPLFSSWGRTLLIAIFGLWSAYYLKYKFRKE